MAEARRPPPRGARGVIREIDHELERVNKGLSGYEPLLREREQLLRARSALTGEPSRKGGSARISQDDVAAYLAAHPHSWPADIAKALGVPVTNVSAHLYRAKHTRFVRSERGWSVRSEGAAG
jgi:hypothetical protein